MGFDQETWRRGEKLISRDEPQQMGWPCNRLCRSFATRWIRVTQTHGTSNSWKILTDPLPNRVHKNKFNDQILWFVSQVAPNFRPSDIRRVVAVFQRLHGFYSTGSEAWTALAAVGCWVVGNSSRDCPKWILIPNMEVSVSSWGYPQFSSFLVCYFPMEINRIQRAAASCSELGVLHSTSGSQLRLDPKIWVFQQLATKI